VEGNYVVVSTNAGAVTWCSGNSGCIGEISSTNGVVGLTSNDFSGGNIVALTNGNFLIAAGYMDLDGITDGGAVRWCSGTLGCIGAISSSNAIVGSTANDYLGSSVSALSNGDFVVNATTLGNPDTPVIFIGSGSSESFGQL